jgi:hypothetical protein
MDLSALKGIEKFLNPTFQKRDYFQGQTNPQEVLNFMPGLIASLFKNETSLQIKEVTEAEGEDAIQVLLREFNEISSKPFFTDDQKLTLNTVAEMLDYYYKAAELMKMTMLALTKQGYIQAPKSEDFSLN